jgi:hypothetical protein
MQSGSPVPLTMLSPKKQIRMCISLDRHRRA